VTEIAAPPTVRVWRVYRVAPEYSDSQRRGEEGRNTLVSVTCRSIKTKTCHTMLKESHRSTRGHT
jgi:hypothetical protein